MEVKAFDTRPGLIPSRVELSLPLNAPSPLHRRIREILQGSRPCRDLPAKDGQSMSPSSSGADHLPWENHRRRDAERDTLPADESTSSAIKLLNAPIPHRPVSTNTALGNRVEHLRHSVRLPVREPRPGTHAGQRHHGSNRTTALCAARKATVVNDCESLRFSRLRSFPVTQVGECPPAHVTGHTRPIDGRHNNGLSHRD